MIEIVFGIYIVTALAIIIRNGVVKSRNEKFKESARNYELTDGTLNEISHVYGNDPEIDQAIKDYKMKRDSL